MFDSQEINNNSDILIVAFAGRGLKYGITQYEFVSVLDRLNCDQLYIKENKPSWYQECFADILLYLKLKVKKYKKVIFIGNSMGGYGAILFGWLLNVNKIIAFAPQTFLDKYNRDKHNDTRWENELDLLNQTKLLDLNHIKHDNIDLYYAKDFHLDKLHAMHIECNLKPFEGKGHAGIKSLWFSGKLRNIIKEAING
jgi:pimeloyl-ACP methyl ester carboxylesterase